MKSADVSHGLAAGQVYRVEFPFVRVEVDDFMDGEPCKVKAWKPGVRFEDDGPESCKSVADGAGTMIIEIVSLHRPSTRNPMMAFYIRRWEYPDGITARTRGLKIKSASALKRITQGYRYEYEVEDATP